MWLRIWYHHTPSNPSTFHCLALINPHTICMVNFHYIKLSCIYGHYIGFPCEQILLSGSVFCARCSDSFVLWIQLIKHGFPTAPRWGLPANLSYLFGLLYCPGSASSVQILNRVESTSVVVSTIFSSVHSPTRPRNTSKSFFCPAHQLISSCVQVNFYLTSMHQSGMFSYTRMDNHIGIERSLKSRDIWTILCKVQKFIYGYSFLERAYSNGYLTKHIPGDVTLTVFGYLEYHVIGWIERGSWLWGT